MYILHCPKCQAQNAFVSNNKYEMESPTPSTLLFQHNGYCTQCGQSVRWIAKYSLTDAFDIHPNTNL